MTRLELSPTDLQDLIELSISSNINICGFRKMLNLALMELCFDLHPWFVANALSGFRIQNPHYLSMLSADLWSSLKHRPHAAFFSSLQIRNIAKIIQVHPGPILMYFLIQGGENCLQTVINPGYGAYLSKMLVSKIVGCSKRTILSISSQVKPYV